MIWTIVKSSAEEVINLAGLLNLKMKANVDPKCIGLANKATDCAQKCYSNNSVDIEAIKAAFTL